MPSGGKRKGSGRKPKPDKKIKYATKLRPDQIAWLKKQRNQAKTIENALDDHRVKLAMASSKR